MNVEILLSACNPPDKLGLSGKEKHTRFSKWHSVTLLLIMLTRGPLGHLVFSCAHEIKYANKTSSLNSVAMVKLTFSSYY